MTARQPVRVLFHFDGSPRLQDRLAPLLDDLDIRWCAEHDEERFRDLLPDTDVLWHVLRPVTDADLERAPRLQLIQKLGSGVNTIDLVSARRRGITVSNMVGANAQAVAESALMLMLAALRRTVELDAATRLGDGWPLDTSLADRVGELAGRTVGLVGFGEIARKLERPLVALGARVLHTTRRTDSADENWRSLDDLLVESDVVSLHLPLDASTTHLLDTRRLGLMKPGAILVNTARGELVDEDALHAALTSGRMAAAGLDTFTVEPVDSTNPLLALRNVVVTPHVAWLTAETIERCVTIAADNCRRLIRGDSLRNIVP
ncbi:2-hydroxyacid dehydrogenase [Prescottella subtropica]|uniref:2-hydroxyacid dehydrogenase n=1 Tax=Prescottella subtropica TaxID=2545757 RepID=UPI001F4FAE7B|nr:2-hydroxyacid dehydrogenase [Prescottella subtropica]